jgi:hypothetical protein
MDEASHDVIAVTLLALATGLAFIAGCAVYYGRAIRSARIPMQWGLSGEPTWLAPRLVGLWFAFGFTALTSAFLLALALHQPEKLVSLVVATVLLIGTNMWVQMFHLRRVIRWQADVSAG